jgi:hypothetical protein
MKRTRFAIAPLGLAPVRAISVAKVNPAINPEEFSQTATVKEVTSGREIKKVTAYGKVKYRNQFVGA